MTSLVLSRHAWQRVIEFGIAPDVVTEIASRPDRTHTSNGERVCVADAHPEWTVVVGRDGVVVTVLRRTHERWEHEPAPPARPPIASTPDVVEDPRPSRFRSTSSRRRPPSQARDGAVASVLVDPDVLRLAHELADGDLRRLQLNSDGSVSILNRPRGTRP